MKNKVDVKERLPITRGFSFDRERREEVDNSKQRSASGSVAVPVAAQSSEKQRSSSLGETFARGASVVDEFVPDWLAAWRLQQQTTIANENSQPAVDRQVSAQPHVDRQVSAKPLHPRSSIRDIPRSNMAVPSNILRADGAPRDRRRSVTFGGVDTRGEFDKKETIKLMEQPARSILSKPKSGRGERSRIGVSISLERGASTRSQKSKPDLSARLIGTYI